VWLGLRYNNNNIIIVIVIIHSVENFRGLKAKAMKKEMLERLELIVRGCVRASSPDGDHVVD